MGWFSKTVPERKWPDTAASIAKSLGSEAESLLSGIRQDAASFGVQLSNSRTDDLTLRRVKLLQLQAVAATVAENGYVSDVVFFLELIYIFMTTRKPADFHNDLENNPFCTTLDPDRTLDLWAEAIAADFSPLERNETLIQSLRQGGARLVLQAKAVTCIACGDPKMAQKISA